MGITHNQLIILGSNYKSISSTRMSFTLIQLMTIENGRNNKENIELEDFPLIKKRRIINKRKRKRIKWKNTPERLKIWINKKTTSTEKNQSKESPNKKEWKFTSITFQDHGISNRSLRILWKILIYNQNNRVISLNMILIQIQIDKVIPKQHYKKQRNTLTIQILKMICDAF